MCYEPLPRDPVILLSYINTKLRDFYPSLSELCRALDVEPSRICASLKAIGYQYDPEKNQFL